MSEKEHPNTEQKIKDAAKKVFLDKGFDGARMQQIADEAGINKALLHYYYRSKEKLFDTIFFDAFNQFMPKIGEVMMSDMPLFDKIRGFVSHYIDMLIANPHLPVFVLYELKRRPEKIVNQLKNSGIKPALFNQFLKKEIENGTIINIEFINLIVNMIGLCLFPFVGRPILEGFLFEGNKNAYNAFLDERKEHVAGFIINAIRRN